MADYQTPALPRSNWTGPLSRRRENLSPLTIWYVSVSLAILYCSGAEPKLQGEKSLRIFKLAKTGQRVGRKSSQILKFARPVSGCWWRNNPS